jgi:hypothetical protein
MAIDTLSLGTIQRRVLVVGFLLFSILQLSASISADIWNSQPRNLRGTLPSLRGFIHLEATGSSFAIQTNPKAISQKGSSNLFSGSFFRIPEISPYIKLQALGVNRGSFCWVESDWKGWGRCFQRIVPKGWLRSSRSSSSRISCSENSKLEAKPKRVAIIGSGNFACAIARIVGANCKRHSGLVDEVRMWVFEEVVSGRKLSEIINSDHENVKYMPGIKLPTNIIADPDLKSTAKDSDVLIFCLPHQFLPGVCEKILGSHAPNCIAISLIKAVDFDENGIVLVSDIIRQKMNGMDVSVLMGANLANEIGSGQFCETTIGYRDEANGILLKEIFNDPLFQVSIVNEVAGVEVCGALKNVSEHLHSDHSLMCRSPVSL